MLFRVLILSFCCAIFSLSGSYANVKGKPVKVKEYTFKVQKSFPHDRTAYTQGLFIKDGIMYESTGQYGESSMRKVDISTGNILSKINFNRAYFIEGSCFVEGRIYILTWREGICFVYSGDMKTKLTEFRYNGEGWGLTFDGKSLIMSDGSSRLSFIDPNTFIETRHIDVTLFGRKVSLLNELEYIDGEIWANVYGSNMILIIDPKSGEVTGRVDCTNLLPSGKKTLSTDVLNGIAWDSQKRYLYLTGKNWPLLFRISLIDK